MNLFDRKCNLCGSSDWKNMGKRIEVRCGTCSALERTRAIKLVIDHLKLPRRNSRILHFAPEPRLAFDFFNASPEGYDPVDYTPDNFPQLNVKKFDLVRDSQYLPSNYYDLIVHSHVLEHIPCNLAFIFYHLFRTLKPEGYHIFCIPFMSGSYDEYFGELPPEEATKRFGQKDHVRKFGTADVDRHLGMIVKLKDKYDLSDYADNATMDLFNIPVPDRSGLNSSTIFVTRKSDYLLAFPDLGMSVK